MNWAAIVQPKAYSAVHVFGKNTTDLRALVLSNPQHIARGSSCTYAYVVSAAARFSEKKKRKDPGSSETLGDIGL